MVLQVVQGLFERRLLNVPHPFFGDQVLYAGVRKVPYEIAQFSAALEALDLDLSIDLAPLKPLNYHVELPDLRLSLT